MDGPVNPREATLFLGADKIADNSGLFDVESL